MVFLTSWVTNSEPSCIFEVSLRHLADADEHCRQAAKRSSEWGSSLLRFIGFPEVHWISLDHMMPWKLLINPPMQPDFGYVACVFIVFHDVLCRTCFSLPHWHKEYCWNRTEVCFLDTHELVCNMHPVCYVLSLTCVLVQITFSTRKVHSVISSSWVA